MTFSTDDGGFKFSCEDAKLSLGASTWNTRLSQLGKISGPVFVMTGLLPDPDYISQIIGKRPRNIFIIANTKAEAEAKLIKSRYPETRIALHADNNAKIVLVSPDTVWVSSSDFGKTRQIEAAVGLHSTAVYTKAHGSLFEPTWARAREIT